MVLLLLLVTMSDTMLLADPPLIVKSLQFVSCFHVTIASAIVIVDSRSGCSCCYYGVPVALGGRQNVMVTKMLIENVLTLLMLIEDC